MCDFCVNNTLPHPSFSCSFPSREVEFIQKEDAERRRLEEAEKAHLAEIQGLQVRVNLIHLPNTATLLISHLCCLVVLPAKFSIHIYLQTKEK